MRGVWLKRRLQRFFADDRGASTTVEFVLWVPVFILVFCILIDIAFILFAQARSYDVAATAARQWAVGTLVSEADAEQFLRDNGDFNAAQPDVSGTTETASTVIISMEFPVEDIDLTGVLGFVSSQTVRIVVERAKE
ncbi:MAG: TadE family protein [Pseudomonadota bacterium]